INCENEMVSGISFDGGYAEYMFAPVEALARIPDSLDPADAGPLLCAGLTTFNALRHSGAEPGDLVAVQGVGGMGNLGLQVANKCDNLAVAVDGGPENPAHARKLGEHEYIYSKATNAAEELRKLGGARVILSTAPSSKAMSEIFGGLGRRGKLLVIGADVSTPLEIPSV